MFSCSTSTMRSLTFPSVTMVTTRYVEGMLHNEHLGFLCISQVYEMCAISRHPSHNDNYPFIIVLFNAHLPMCKHTTIFKVKWRSSQCGSVKLACICDGTYLAFTCVKLQESIPEIKQIGLLWQSVSQSGAAGRANCAFWGCWPQASFS